MVVTRRQVAAAKLRDEDAITTTTTPPDIDIDTTNNVDSEDAGDGDRRASDAAEAGAVPVSRAKSKTWGVDFWKRLISGLCLSAFFVAIIRGGHIWVCIGVILMEIGMYREILRLGLTAGRDGGQLPLWLAIGWYFFWACQFLFYGKAVLSHFDDQGQSFMNNKVLQNMLKHHSFYSFAFYCTGFIGFVLSLRQDQYHKQFAYLGRSLVALVIVVVQSHFMILNVTQGLIWFILPSVLIIVNDSFAYFCGRLFGRHSLTALSPKKTWEGYLGAGFLTMISAFFISDLLSRYQSLICPIYSFTECTFWSCPSLSCDDTLPYVFVKKIYTFSPIPSLVLNIPYRPVQLHATALGLFAAVIAPFGGFFASGAKRAFAIKDFANIFPGHGGVTDRVDCQLLMAVFTYVYLINFVQVSFTGSPDVGKVMTFVAELTTSEQVQLLHEIYSRLRRKNVPEDVLNLTKLIVNAN